MSILRTGKNQESNNKPFWVTGKVLTKITKLSAHDLKAIRKNNPEFYRMSSGGGYLYNTHLLPETFLSAQPNEQKREA